jgi:hypothetical protein
VLIILSLGCIRDESESYKLAKGGEKANINFEKEIINERMKLTIYYSPIDRESIGPLTNEIIKHSYEYKITINSDKLRDYLDELQKVENIVFQKPVTDYINIRVCCDFHKNDKTVFSFSLSDDENVLVNNFLIVKNNRIFYDFIIPFLPQVVADEYKEALKKIKF